MSDEVLSPAESEVSKAGVGTRDETALRTAGQRKVNILWEITQSVLALFVTGTELYTAIHHIEAKAVDTAFIMILTMYFVRTNHQKIGGVGGTDYR